MKTLLAVLEFAGEAAAAACLTYLVGYLLGVGV